MQVQKGGEVVVKEENKDLAVDLSVPKLTFSALFSFRLLLVRGCSLLTFVMFSVPTTGVSTQ